MPARQRDACFSRLNVGTKLVTGMSTFKRRSGVQRSLGARVSLADELPVHSRKLDDQVAVAQAGVEHRQSVEEYVVRHSKMPPYPRTPEL